MSLNRTVNAAMAAKRDPALEKEAQDWIESIIGEKFPLSSYEDSLKDGIVLCKLINKLAPKSVAKITTKGGGFALRENVNAFTNAARKYGVPDNELFQTVDLFEKKNIGQVTLCIHALGRQAQKHNFDGPVLGVKMCEENKREFTEEQLNAGKNTVGLLTEYNKGATMSGTIIGNTRHM